MGSYADLINAKEGAGVKPNTKPDQTKQAARPDTATEPRRERPVSPGGQSSESREVGKEGSREVGKDLIRLFDINETPYRKDSFLFTDDEFEAMEDLKLDLRRKFDLKATKNDVARCAMQYLFEEYYRNGESSVIVKKLKKKTPR